MDNDNEADIPIIVDMSIVPENEWIKEGRKARLMGLVIDENPYPKGSKKYIEWEAGWDFQDYDMLSTDNQGGQ